MGVALLGTGDARAEWSSQPLGGTTVEVYAPDALSPVGDGRALMVVLHGCSQASTALRDEGNLEPAADSMGVVMAVPAVPNGGVIAGCWDYYGPAHSRNSPHVSSVLGLVDGLLADPALDIDPNQVYVIGLSSGGAESIILGCVAPDVFAGVGVVAGPSLGTGLTDITTVATTADAAANLCTQLAGADASALRSQAALTFSDAADFTVAQGYNAVNAGMFGAVISSGLDSMEASTVDFAGLAGTNPTGTVTEYADDQGVRVAQLDSTSNIGHAWPSGSGMAGGVLSFVNGNGLDMAQYAVEFFAAHNPRAGGWDPGDPDDPDDPDDPGDDSDGDGGSGDGDSGDSGNDTANPGTSDSNGDDGGDSDGDVEGDDDEHDCPEASGDGGCAVAPERTTLPVFLGLLVAGVRRRRLRNDR